jgi:hypothetical protein
MLITGAEIVAEVIHRPSESYCIVKNPLMFVPAGEGKIAAMRVLPMAKEDQDIKVDNSHIVMTATPSAEVVEGYASQFSNLSLPPTPGLVVPD